MQLWRLSSAQFNNWRAANDIPLLYDYLATILPSFNDWVASTGLTREKMHRFFPSGELFDGESRKLYFRTPEPAEFGDVYQCTDRGPEEEVDWWKLRGKDIRIEGSFEPYFGWLKRTGDSDGYFCYDKTNSQYSNTFVFALWHGGEKTLSRANLFKSHAVLKLGGIKLPAGASFNARNLDFCDLDFLEVGSGWLGSRLKPINFSSCREMLFNGAEANFFHFYQCATWDLQFQDTNVYDLRFRRCATGASMRFESCRLQKISFEASMVTPIFTECQPSQIEYTPDMLSRRPAADANAYRAIRGLFQSVGLTSEASRFFYLEQSARRKSLYSPYSLNIDRYSGLNFPGEVLLKGASTLPWLPSTAKSRDHAKRSLIFHLRAWLDPRYTLTTFGFKLKWAVSVLDWLMWGYGERPARIFGTALAWISFYALIYAYLVPGIKTSGGNQISGAVDHLYFSIVTFTTLGYGDLSPTTALSKLICGSEALIGAFTMGLVVAGFSNRNRY